MHTGAVKAGSALPMAAYLTLAAFDNPTDHDSNFDFVIQIIIDATFEEYNLTWRAVESPALHHRP